jgi:hypothetical protein
MYSTASSYDMARECVVKVDSSDDMFNKECAFELFKSSKSPIVSYVCDKDVYTIFTHKFVDGISFHAYIGVICGSLLEKSIVPTFTYVPIVNEIINLPNCIHPMVKTMAHDRVLTLTTPFPDKALQLFETTTIGNIKSFKKYANTFGGLSFSQTCLLISAMYIFKATSKDTISFGFIGGFTSEQFSRFNNLASMNVILERPPNYNTMSATNIIKYFINEITESMRTSRSQFAMSYGLATIGGVKFNMNTHVDVAITVAPPYSVDDSVELIGTTLASAAAPLYMGFTTFGETFNVGLNVRTSCIDTDIKVMDSLIEYV